MTPMATFLPVICLPIASRSIAPELFVSKVMTSASTWFRTSRLVCKTGLGEHALLRGISPTSVAPDFGLGAQSLHCIVEHLQHEFGIDDTVHNAARSQQMDLRLFLWITWQPASARSCSS